MKSASIAIIRAILSKDISSFESRKSLEASQQIEINIQEEINFNNPIELMPEIPCPIDPSNLEYTDPIGYMWSDGTITKDEDRGSRVYSKPVPKDGWIPVEGTITLNDPTVKGVLTSDTEKSDVIIYGTRK